MPSGSMWFIMHPYASWLKSYAANTTVASNYPACLEIWNSLALRVSLCSLDMELILKICTYLMNEYVVLWISFGTVYNSRGLLMALYTSQDLEGTAST